MIEYNKIDTLYKRDMEGSKKLLEGEFRNPAVECPFFNLSDKTYISKLY